MSTANKRLTHDIVAYSQVGLWKHLLKNSFYFWQIFSRQKVCVRKPSIPTAISALIHRWLLRRSSSPFHEPSSLAQRTWGRKLRLKKVVAFQLVLSFARYVFLCNQCHTLWKLFAWPNNKRAKGLLWKAKHAFIKRKVWSLCQQAQKHPPTSH